MGRLFGKRAIVTGASSGIGRATALRFAQEGARLLLVGRDRAALEDVSSKVAAAAPAQSGSPGPASVVAEADVTDPSQCEAAVSLCVEQLGGVDVLVNAAGIIGTGTLETTSRDAWQAMMDINLHSVFHLMQLARPHLEASCGSIVNVSSVTGQRAFPGVLAYCVSKAAVDQLTRCTALELAASGVRVNAVCPGVVVSNLHRRGGMDEEAYARFLEHSKGTHPLGRPGQPDDVAESVLFLASGESGWVTGVTLSVDGGRHLTCAR